MALYCSITNEVPEVPVVSPASGHIFEKRIIEKYIAENGCDPFTSKELKIEDLIEIKTPAIAKPVPPNITSIPAILKLLQDEWDATMLHTFTIRQQLQTVRQELSRTLYQHDAACRTITRLHKENIAAREVLANLKPEAVGQSTDAQNVIDENEKLMEKVGMTAEIIKKLKDNATELTTERKKRGKSVPDDFTPPNEIKEFKLLSSHPGLHSASLPGITSLDVHPVHSHKILTGGNDKNAVVFDRNSEQVIAILKGHSKKVTRVSYHSDENTALTASADGTVRVWNIDTADTKLTLRFHEGAITGLSLHPTGDFILTCSEDQSWGFSDICDGRLITKVFDSSKHQLTVAQFHPDGLIFGIGTSDSQVKIWDIQEQSNVAIFPGHSGPISAIAFSENGYYLATAADDCSIKLWDLRKLKNFKTLQLHDKYEIRDLCFDQSGTYLGVAGNDVRAYLCKQWSELTVFSEHTAVATGIRFGYNAKFVASTSMDRTLKLYGNSI